MQAATWLTGTRTAVLLDLDTGTWPVIRAFGPAPVGPGDPVAAARALRPAQPQSTPDSRTEVGLLPEHATGSPGSPGLEGAFADGTGWAPRFGLTAIDLAPDRAVVAGRDPRAGLEVRVEVHLDRHDVLAVRAAVTNLRGTSQWSPPHAGAADGATEGAPDGTAAAATAPTAGEPVPTPGLALPEESPGLGRDPLPAEVPAAHRYQLRALRLTLPLSDRAREVATVTGRWIRELHLQRSPLQLDRIVHTSTRGSSSHEDPPLVFVGTPGFGEEAGEVLAAHLAWPGNHELAVERTPAGTATVQLAEYLHPGELVLGPGQTYRTPWLLATTSTSGLNGVSDAFHAHVRARPEHPRGPRPVTLNTWEAVYFDHDRDRLLALARAAAEVGIERFVLDDGWFVGRHDDTAGLGDWIVDEAKHPGGLRPLADAVRGLGMEFGLWVEPEMVNPDSQRFRADPTVALAAPGVPLQRNQLVLDLVRDDVRADVRAQLDAVLHASGARAVKWDLNRAQLAAEHAGRPGSHAQVRAVLDLLAGLRAAHPDVEVESCASGGGRVDLGILTLTSRVWTSDCNDPVERQRIQRGASYLLPPELLGSHVGAATAHTTFRTTALSFRLATAFFCHLGVEWDLTAVGEEDRARLAEAIALHREWREVLHGGRVVRVDHPDEAALVHGVVTPDRALFCLAQLATAPTGRPAAVRCPGLEPGRRYTVRLVPALTDFTGPQKHAPGWYADGGVTLSGHHLATHGVAIHVNQPGTATVLAVTAST